MKFKEYLKEYKKHEKPPSTFFHKMISKNGAKVFSYFSILLGITPNQISLLSVVFLCLGCVVVANDTSTIPMLLLAVLLFQLSYICDCSDGVVARYRGLSSKFGGYLDILLDRIGGLIFSIAIGYYGLIVLGVKFPQLFLFALTIYFCYQLSSTLRPHYFPELSGTMKNKKEKNSIPFLALKFIYEFIDTGIYYFIISISIVFGVIELVVYFYGAISLVLFSANLYFLYMQEKNSKITNI